MRPRRDMHGSAPPQGSERRAGSLRAPGERSGMQPARAAAPAGRIPRAKCLNQPRNRPPHAAMSSDVDAKRQEQADKLAKRLRCYQDKLLQVTHKNRSVLLRRVYMKHNFDLTQADALKEGTVARVLSKAVGNIAVTLNDRKDKGASHNILPESIDSKEADSTRAHLRTLSRNMAQIEEETGQQAGYLGFPFLQGHPAADFFVRGPVVLFPISLARRAEERRSGWFLGLEDRRPILNGALIAALRKKGGKVILEDYEERFEDLIEDAAQPREDPVGHFLTKVSEWLHDVLQVEGAPDPEPEALRTLTRDDTDSMERSPLRVVNHAVIGSFPQADNEIYKDYARLIEGAGTLDAGMVTDLLDVDVQDDEESDEQPAGGDEKPDPADIDGTGDRELNAVLASDSSQDQVMLKSKTSDMIVVGGPPGTGKSQVIVNLISDALAGGQRVLVVCQKRAALEVVQQRLGKVGLDRYVVFIQKETDDRAKMYQQLSGIIEREPAPGTDPQESLDLTSSKIDECVSYLAGLGAAMRKKHFGGATAHTLYCNADGRYAPVLDMRPVMKDLTWDGLDPLMRRISGVEDAYRRFEDPSHPWHGRRSFAGLGIRERGDLDRALERAGELSAGCVLAGSADEQRALLSSFESYAGCRGMLGSIKKRGPAKQIRSILGGAEVDDAYVAGSMDGVRRGVEFWRALETVLGRLGAEGASKLRAMAPDPRSLGARLSEMRTALAEFDSMQELDKKKAEWNGGEFGLLEQARSKFGKDGDWAGRIRQEAYAYWLQEIEGGNPILTGDPVSNYNDRRDELAQLMDSKHALVVEKIRHDVEGAVRPDEMYGRGLTEGQKGWKAFLKELKRKRKVKPVRKMFEEHGDRMFQTAPCWLASPESVSRVFPLRRGLFDLVIVDEASQLAVERAIPFLYRAGRAVVAGDEKQLPPFDLFQVREEEDEADEGAPDEKSLLNLAKAVPYRTYGLEWHYRSRYEELIDYSNHGFYHGRLNVSPNAAGDPSHPPIRWVKCNGTWDHRTNHVEAERVADEALAIWRDAAAAGREMPTVGIITFNDSQQDLVNDIIEKRRDTDPEFAEMHAMAHKDRKLDEYLFVKNIENVQGDERDYIIFSVGYALDPDGNFANRFGTLSSRGGENRLNVAVTRAKVGMVVVCSIEPGRISATSKNAGPRMLRDFLRYAEAVSARNDDAKKAVLDGLNPGMGRPDGGPAAGFESPFEEMVCRGLEARGHKVQAQVGSSGYRIDLAVVDPRDENRFLLGIECDGATFHSAKSVRERDVMRQRFLEERGWKIERIWSRNWWRDPGKEMRRIESRINELAGR